MITTKQGDDILKAVSDLGTVLTMLAGDLRIGRYCKFCGTDADKMLAGLNSRVDQLAVAFAEGMKRPAPRKRSPTIKAMVKFARAQRKATKARKQARRRR